CNCDTFEHIYTRQRRVRLMPAPATTITVLTREQYQAKAHPCDANAETIMREGDGEPKTVRAAAVKVGRYVRKHQLSSVLLTIPRFAETSELTAFVRTWTEGIISGLYKIKSYKRDEVSSPTKVQIVMLVEDESTTDEVKRIARIAA